MLIDGIICIAAGFLAYSIHIGHASGTLIMGWNDVIMCLFLTMFINNYMMARFGFYSEGRSYTYAAMVWTLCIVVFFDTAILSVLSVLIKINPFSRLFVIAYALLMLTSFIITRVALYFYLDKRALTVSNSRQILLIGNNEKLGTLLDALEKQPSWGHKVAGYINIDSNPHGSIKNISSLGSIDAFDKIIHEKEIDEIIFSIPGDYKIDLRKYFEKCREMGMTCRIVPGLFDLGGERLKVETLQNIPSIALYSSMSNASGLFYKKIIDIIIGTIGFIIFLILLPFIALAIKLDSKGPILFKQERVGMNNRRFKLYKFRTMVTNAEEIKKDLLCKSEMSGPIFKMENDPRITKVGRFLRKTSLDEMPQFINVLKGEMSIVGTRPPTPDEVAKYEDWHRRRISMKPGLTGLWQVSGRNRITDFDEIVELDLKYIDGWRFHRDIMIILKTIWVVLLRKGAK